MNEKKYLYAEPVRGEVYRYLIVDERNDYYVVQVGGDDGCLVLKEALPDGSLSAPSIMPGRVWEEDEFWQIKYQDSLSLRVSQHTVDVYFVEAVKRGKKKSRVLVIDGEGQSYTLLIPTVPMPRVGQCISALRLDLNVVSLFPCQELVERVVRARAEDSGLL